MRGFSVYLFDMISQPFSNALITRIVVHGLSVVVLGLGDAVPTITVRRETTDVAGISV